MDNRIRRIRAEERKYHEACYDNYRLFEAGTWLHKPVKSVMETLAIFESYERLQVLDLGCGVGRNSIPIAAALPSQAGSVVCVDLLPAALDKLMVYSRQHGDEARIQPVLSDIGDFDIAGEQFDLIVAVSALEHVESEAKLAQVLHRMVQGTKTGGVNCIIMSSNIQERDAATGESLEPFMELNMATDQVMGYLEKAYEGWTVLKSLVKPLQFHIERADRNIVLTSDCLTWIVRKQG